MRTINDAGLALIKEFEGLKLKAYRDGGGVLTVGYGHTGNDVKPGLVISEETAEILLNDDLDEAESGVDKAVTIELTDNQFAACVSLAFNVGVNAFKKSTLVRKLNGGLIDAAADQFLRWDMDNGKVVPGLTRRRKAERALFLAPDKLSKTDKTGVSTTDINTTKVTETKTISTETPDTTTEVRTETSFVPAEIKEVAKTGMSAIGTRLAGGGLSGGTMATIGGVLAGNWKVILAGLVVLVIGSAIWMLVYYQRKQIQILTARINSDKTKNDIKFVKKPADETP